MVTGTLNLAARGVSGFLVVFLVVMFGFANAFMLTFGQKVMGYRNMSSSAFSLVKVSGSMPHLCCGCRWDAHAY